MKSFLSVNSKKVSLLVPFSVDPNGVLKLLNNLKIHKASGPDGLSARVLEECSSEIAPIQALIYNETLAQGTVPDDWRQANVAPIFKRKGRIMIGRKIAGMANTPKITEVANTGIYE